MTKLTQWGIKLQLRTVAETPLFCRQADKLFNEAERRELISLLASDPFAGIEIPGTGGVRKLRFATQGQGKRGGARIIYFHADDQMPVYAACLREIGKNRYDGMRTTTGCGVGDCHQGDAKGKDMSTTGEDLIQSLKEALAHAKGEGPAIVHEFPTPREVRERVRLTQAEMAPLMGMSLSGYRKWEQGERKVSGPATNLLRVIANEPEAVIRALRTRCV